MFIFPKINTFLLVQLTLLTGRIILTTPTRARPSNIFFIAYTFKPVGSVGTPTVMLAWIRFACIENCITYIRVISNADYAQYGNFRSTLPNINIGRRDTAHVYHANMLDVTISQDMTSNKQVENIVANVEKTVS